MWKPILASLAAAAAVAASLALASPARAASLTPPNLVTASSLNNPDLLLVWPYAAGGPLEAMSWSTFKSQMAGGLAGSFLTPANNLSDVGNATTARVNLGVTATGADTTYAYRADNLSDLGSASAARTNLGLGTAATQNTGTSGASVALLNGTNTWSADQTLSGARLIFTGTAPTVSSCGTSPIVLSNSTDSAGGVAFGTGAPASCTITFHSTWPSQPFCTFGSGNNVVVYFNALSTTTLQLTLSTGVSGAVVHWHCQT